MHGGVLALEARPFLQIPLIHGKNHGHASFLNESADLLILISHAFFSIQDSSVGPKLKLIFE